MAFVSLASCNTMFLNFSGIGTCIFQRPSTASAYGFPAERGDAASAATSKYG